jgi:hypothetical protein
MHVYGCGCTGTCFCACSLTYPACTILSAASLAPRHFRHYLINSTIFEKSYWTYMCAFIFSAAFIGNISHSENSASYYHKCGNLLMYSTCYSCWILIKLGIFSTYFRKELKYQISSKSVQWEPRCSMWTGRHDKANSHFFSFANAPKKNQHSVNKLKTCQTFSSFIHTLCCITYIMDLLCILVCKI